MKKEVQEFLESLEEDDIHKIRKALKVYDTVETLGWFFKWLALSVLAVIVFVTQIKEHIVKLFN